MTRVRLLRLGYAAFALAMVCLAGSFLPALGSLVVLSPLLAVLGALLFAFSDDDLPKWAGIAFLAYALATLAAFLAATPATIRLSFWKGFANPDPPAIFAAIQNYLAIGLYVMVPATALVAAWEREHLPRILLLGAIVGVVGVAVLTVALDPAALPSGGGANDDEALLRAQSQASWQGRLLNGLLGVSLAAGAAGAAWSAARPEEIH